MKKILILACAALVYTGVNAQKFSDLDKSPMDATFYPANAAKRSMMKTADEKMAASPQIRVLYGRPALKGRNVFPDITKYGNEWRVGANESTEIMLYKPAIIAGKKLEAGRYTMVIVPTEKVWTVHLSTENDGWGNYGRNKDMDVVTTDILVTMDEESVENLSMALYSPEKDNVVHLKIGWGNYRAELPIAMEK